MVGWLYYPSVTVVRTYFRLFTSLKIEGLDNVPRKGPILVVSNHLSNFDPPLISVNIRRIAIFMAKEELFRSRLLGYFLRKLGAFPVHRGQLDRQALRDAEKVLAENYALVMFPEAKRSKNARLQEALPGSAMIALRNKATIVPTAITGTEQLAGRKVIFGRLKVTLRFGKPFQLTETSRRRSRESLVEATNLIMEHVAEILPPEYRGVYASEKGQDEPAD